MAVLPTLNEIDAQVLRLLQQNPSTSAVNSRFPQSLRRYFINQFQFALPFEVRIPTLRKLVAATASAQGVIAAPADYLCDALVFWTNGTLGSSNQSGRLLEGINIDQYDRQRQLWNRVQDNSVEPVYVTVKANDSTGAPEFLVQPLCSGMNVSNGFYLNYCLKPADVTADGNQMNWMKAYEANALMAPAAYAARELYSLDAGGSAEMVAIMDALYRSQVNAIRSKANTLLNFEDSIN